MESIEVMALANIGILTLNHLSVTTVFRGTIPQRNELGTIIVTKNRMNAMIVNTRMSVRIVYRNTCSRNTLKLLTLCVLGEK